jgi:hypothetical protein
MRSKYKVERDVKSSYDHDHSNKTKVIPVIRPGITSLKNFDDIKKKK